MKTVLPFGVSTSVLGLTQAACVAAPRELRIPALSRLRSGGWALIPAASVVVVTLGIRAAAGAAHGLTWLALLAVPPLAAAALGRAAHGARAVAALAVIPLFALAWADRGGLAGQAAALLLTALSCVTLGVLLAAVAPPSVLKLGILAMAAVDTAMVASDLLQHPNDVLNAVAPPAGLPRLQSAYFGSALMGYGDFFAAAVLGALTAARARTQRRAAILTATLALFFDLLFLVVDELPATVPVALALVFTELLERRSRSAEEDLGRLEQPRVEQLGLAQRFG